ncbi:MAG: 50S ribosomal protein L6 [Sneathiella sp.]|jgi:large subunit ribosomal protein L6|uniref:50S ribosomal protein L6 n=1 Tax=Sneathiella sp. TaxID=1964365 RepID=UPI000C53C905|nr:50S ribosomal protein L6 [Sneathiella sp.]MAL79793.1 50S ribosomal protein L6 [Sneathiella sp.]|tara:strand:- start:654 stop:1187 length:534 start_codon:yes stop_codon:yes gene_type:complete
MSRIGKHPVTIPSGVDVQMSGSDITVKGSKGVMSMTFVDDVIVDREDDKIWVKPRTKSNRSRQMWGMQRTLLNNLVQGVSGGFTRTLEIVGVGYRAAAQGRTLKLNLGFSHDVDFPIPEGIEIKTPSPTVIEISGADKQQVGQVAAVIRSYRKPEPYKGKGVKYSDEFVFRKEGKKK